MHRLLIGFLVVSTLAASPIYRIAFEGVIFAGTASSLEQPDLVPLDGLAISGEIEYDLGLAPAPVLTAPPAGFPSGAETRYESAIDPVWIVRQTVTIQGLPALVAGLSSTIEFPPVPVPPTGTETTPAVRDQALTLTATTTSVVLTSASFRDDWTDGDLTRFRGSLLAFNVTSATPFLIELPGLQPFLVSTDVSGGGVFSLNDFEWTRTNPFFTTNNRIDARFTLTSVKGEFVPEPGTWGLTGVAAAGLVVSRRWWKSTNG